MNEEGMNQVNVRINECRIIRDDMQKCRCRFKQKKGRATFGEDRGRLTKSVAP